MKMLAPMFLSVLLIGCATCRVGGPIEQCKPHPGGFYEATHAVEGDFGFESVGHFNHCHYRAQDFGQCSGMSVSPSGKEAVWQQSSTGSVMYFARDMSSPIVLLARFPKPSSLERVVWNEAGGTVSLKAWGQPEPLVITIPTGG